MITFRHIGNFNKTEKFLNNASKMNNIKNILERYAKDGVSALASATPKDTAETANSWGYNIKISSKGYYRIVFTNSHVSNGIPIAILIQYGHGTGNGGYVAGRDFINPALQPIFDNLVASLMKEVSQL